MSASDNLHPIQLRKFVNEFGQKHFSDMGLEHPENAEGECEECSSRFLSDSGIRGARSQWYMDPETGINHSVAHVDTSIGPHVVDYTFRQFDQDAPHPLVEPISHFEQRRQMRNFKPTEAWKAVGLSEENARKLGIYNDHS